MAGYFTFWRLSRATFAILLVVVSGAQIALGQYTWVQDTDTSASWDDVAQWSCSGCGTYPNATDATVVINAPTTSSNSAGTGSAAYVINFPATDVKLGELKIDNTGYDNHFRTNFTGGRLVFETTSGTAKYTETVGTVAGPANSQYQFQMPVVINSDLLITQDNYPNLNTGTTFSNLVTGSSARTITKEGYGGIQFNNNSVPADNPYAGKFVINRGGIRFLAAGQMLASTGITVNSGGQLMLADNGPQINPEWNMATGAVLNLNGTGKATPSPSGITVTTADGALRFAIQPAHTSTIFHNDVVLQSNSVISITSNGVPSAGQTFTTGTLDGIVSGPGGLTKHGDGTLVLSNALDSYGGDTHILTAPTATSAVGPGLGMLSLSNPILPDGRDLYMSATRTALSLNFGGTDTIRSFFIDGVAQPTGIWGTTGSGAAHESALITGSGLLNVTALPVVGVPGDYNNNGIVDAGDYVLWRKGGPLQNEVDTPGTVNAADYTAWQARFGNTSGSGASLSAAAVPEPTAFVLFMFIAPLLAGRKVGRTRSC